MRSASRVCLILCFVLIVLISALWVFEHLTTLIPPTELGEKFENSTELQLQIILFWNIFESNYSTIQYCGSNTCLFTSHHYRISDAQVVLMKAPSLNISNYPIPRRPNQLWALFNDVSPKESMYFANEALLQHFNYTATFSRYSDFPLVSPWLSNLSLFTTHYYMLPVAEKSRLRRVAGLAPIVFLQTRSNTLNGRQEYVFELMKYIRVDSYGESLHNKDLPTSFSWNYNENLFHPDMLKFLGRYKFILAYENAVCDDYISEKLWRTLIVGAIPVYYGAPTITDWAPNKKSVIYIRDFSSPAALADFLIKLDANDTEYLTYMEHKYNQNDPIKNRRLHETITAAYGREIMDFGCYLCSQIHKTPLSVSVKIASLSHYNCIEPNALPCPALLKNLALSDFSQKIIEWGNCTAIVLDKIFRLNNTYTKNDLRLMRDKLC